MHTIQTFFAMAYFAFNLFNNVSRIFVLKIN